ncbi:transposition [Cordylochernes scorpioides]|uniref:Transposition n=1 Tax=Cordylochernes scorpioides TaxID=51811 RepID=A0ABY6L2Z6_9ARAC|nr:transposition [Cordylochernes scorpioides]
MSYEANQYELIGNVVSPPIQIVPDYCIKGLWAVHQTKLAQGTVQNGFQHIVEGLGTSLEWADLHTLVVAKKLLTGVAKLWLRSQPTLSTWPELKEAITNEFDNPIDRNIHILLTKRKKQQFESYYENFLNMRELGSQGNLEEAVIKNSICD